MTWVRFDDQFPIHRKVAGLNDAVYRLGSEAIFWCSRNRTDGVIRAAELRQTSKRATPARATELVDRDLWHAAGDLCTRCKERLADAGTPEPRDGWVIHDFLDHQPSREKTDRERTAKAERQAKWLAAKKGGRRNGDASQPPSVDASEDAALRARAPAPETPPRPAPKEAGRSPEAPAAASLRRAGSGGRNSENPDWRTLPAAGVPRDPIDADRARRGAATAREQLRRPPEAS
jgi:hypothetical protein